MRAIPPALSPRLEARERFVVAAGVRARVLECDGGGAPILFIHGLSGWAEQWWPTMQAVAAAGYCAIACDLPGFGLSEAPRRSIRYFDAENPFYALFIAGVLDALGIAKATLVGHSLGGSIAAITTVRYPERVSRLVLASPGGFSATLHRRLQVCGLPFASLVARCAPPALIRNCVRSNFCDPARVPSWFLEQAYRYARREEVGRVMAQVLRSGGQSLVSTWAKKLNAIRCPTLIVWGREDDLLPPPPRSAFAHIAGAELALIEEAGHAVMVEQPERFTELVLSFCRDLGRDVCPEQRNGEKAHETRTAA